MVISMNRVSRDVITKEIKENFPIRMGFRMLDKRGSIVTLDTPVTDADLSSRPFREGDQPDPGGKASDTALR